jgi:hypothetical protein
MLAHDPNARVMGKPSEIALYVLDIWTDHKPGPDGNLIAVDKVKFGKRGAEKFERVDEIPRLRKFEPDVFQWFEPLYEGWKKNNEIKREGMPLEAWPAITKGQIGACKDLGLHVVEDIAEATDTIRQKLGMGANDLITKAKHFVANKDKSANANKIAELEAAVATLTAALEEERSARKAKAKPKAKEDTDG